MEHLLARHASKPHNPLIAAAFFRTGDIESWGRGIEKVRAACAANDTEFPSFNFEPGGLMVIFKGSVPEAESPSDQPGLADGLVERLGKGLGERLGENQKRILELMLQNPNVAIPDIAAAIGISTTAVENNIQKLKDKGVLTRVGSARSGHWEVCKPL